MEAWKKILPFYKYWNSESSTEFKTFSFSIM